MLIDALINKCVPNWASSLGLISYTLEYTRIWKHFEKGFGGYGPFSNNYFLQGITNKTRPVDQK